MSILFFIAITGGIGLAIIGSNLWKGKHIRKRYKHIGIFQWMAPISLWIYNLKSNQFGDKKIEKEFEALYPNQDIHIKIQAEIVKRIGSVLLCIFMGGFFGIVIEFQKVDNTTYENTLYRPEFLQGEKTYEVVVEGLGKKETLQIEVKDKVIAEEEFKNLCLQRIAAVEKKLLGENQSLEEINKDLNYISQIDGINIEWKTNKDDYIGIDGTLKQWTKSGPLEVEIYGTFTYANLKYQHTFVGKLIEREKDSSYYIDLLQETIEKENQLNRENDKINLPDNIEEKQITYVKTEDNDSIVIFLLFLCGGVAVFLSYPKKRKEYLRARNSQLIIDYSTLIFQLSLLIQAGLTIRASIKLMVNQYEKERENGGAIRYSLEELRMTYYSIEGGFNEGYAYEEFGNRCSLYCYIKLGNLLSQNLKQGVSGLGKMLEEEAMLAQEERKNAIRKLGEEASTKLLIPMMLMLIVICMILIIPTFLSM